jgi:hypothetical protein
MTCFGISKNILVEKISLNVSARLVNLACIAGVLTSRPNLSARLDEVVITAEQLEMIFEMFVPSGLADRSPTQIGWALSNREIQPFHKRSVQFH